MPIEDEFLTPHLKSDNDKKSSDPMPFSDSSNPIMQTITFLSSMVHPAIASAAAHAALTEIEKQNLTQPIDLTKLDVKTLTSIAIGAASAKSKVF